MTVDQWISLSMQATILVVAILGYFKASSTHLLVNSKMTQLLEATKLGAFGEGIEHERSRSSSELTNAEVQRTNPGGPP